MLVGKPLKNPNYPQNIGGVQSWKRVKSGAVLLVESGQIHLCFHAPSILRVTFEKDTLDLNPYSVVAKTVEVEPELVEQSDTLTLRTNKLTVEVCLSTYALTIKDAQGGLLSQDDDTLSILSQGQQHTLHRKLQEGERFIGLGEKTGNLDRRGSGYVNYNTDRFGYGPNDDPLYASIPFFVGIHHEVVYGMYLDNSYRSAFNFGASNDRFSSITCYGGTLDYYFFQGDSVAEILSAYTFLTGKTPLPPKWSIGYQQCRYSYYPQSEVLRVAEKFRDKRIPADVIVLDIHYMEKYKIFTWDGERFPNPETMINQLKARGFEVVVICDPGIKIEPDYAPYEDGEKEDVFLKYPDNTTYTAEVWPGWCHFPDFTKATARKWWQKHLATYTDLGIKGFWNDMNEIATWGNMLPEHILFDFEGEGASTLKGRNVYGFQMARSSYESAAALLNERPFILTRAAFAGIQRYSALWTGDNVSSDESMMLGIRLVNSLGLSGVAFCGYDVGGFVGNGHPHLYARWMQLGAFSPFFRGHTMINSNASEPWSYGEEVEEISANFIRLRYQLLPYLYQAFREAAQTGLPVNRSLAIDYTFDASVYLQAYQHQYLFGPSMLIAPLESTKHIQKVYLPKGDWYELFSGECIPGDQAVYNECGIERLPVYVKAGHLLMMYPSVGRNTSETGDLLDIHVYWGASPFETTYYEDDGSTFDYQHGDYYARKISFDPAKKQLRIGRAEGSFTSVLRQIRIILHGFEADVVDYNQFEIKTTKEDYRFIQPISNFDPVMKPIDHQSINSNLSTFTVSNENIEMVFSF